MKKSISGMAIAILALAFIPLQQSTSQAASLDFGSTTAANAYAEVQKRMSAISKMENPNINFVIAPKTSPKFLALANKTVKFAANYYSDFLPISTPITAWVFDDRSATSWMQEALAATGVHPSGYESAFAKQVSATPDKSRDGSLEILLFSTHYADRLGAGDQYEMSHEFTHLNQTYAMPNGKGGLLCWQREGMAEYGALAISGRYSALRYQQETLHGTHYVMNLNSTFGTDWVTFFKQDESKSTGACNPADYSIGALAMQYLEGTYGHAKVLEYVKNVGANSNNQCDEFMKDGIPCSAWRDSFKSVFGVTPSDAYPEIAKFIDGQIAWAKKLKETPYSELVKKDPKAFSYPNFPAPSSKPAAGQICSKTGAKIILNGTEFTCTAFRSAKFYSNIKEVVPWFASNAKPTASSNPGAADSNQQEKDPNFDYDAPDNVIARGRWCPEIGAVGNSWKQEQLKCVKNNKGILTWSTG
jgi:hypothetical protein